MRFYEVARVQRRLFTDVAPIGLMFMREIAKYRSLLCGTYFSVMFGVREILLYRYKAIRTRVQRRGFYDEP